MRDTLFLGLSMATSFLGCYVVIRTFFWPMLQSLLSLFLTLLKDDVYIK